MTGFGINTELPIRPVTASGARVAIPDNEIVIPTILMMTVLVTGVNAGAGTGVIFETGGTETMALFEAGDLSLLNALNLMLFSLVHNPCSTTIYTIYKEKGSKKWTAVAALLPLLLGFALTFVVAQMWRLLAPLS